MPHRSDTERRQQENLFFRSNKLWYAFGALIESLDWSCMFAEINPDSANNAFEKYIKCFYAIDFLLNKPQNHF